MTLKVRADEGMLHEGVPYHVYVGVENKSDVPLYNVNLAIEENPHVSFIFQPEQQFSELVGELKPGETFFVKRPYILIPDNESVSVFNPAPPYLSVCPELRYALYRRRLQQVFRAAPLYEFRAVDESVRGTPKLERERFLKTVGPDPRIPFTISAPYTNHEVARCKGELEHHEDGHPVAKPEVEVTVLTVSTYWPAMSTAKAPLLRELGVAAPVLRMKGPELRETNAYLLG